MILFYRRSALTDSMQGHSLDLLLFLVAGIGGGAQLERLGVPSAAVTLALVVAAALYHVVAVKHLGGTLGQRARGVRIVDWHGRALTYRQAAVRFGAQLVEGALMMVSGPIGFGWLFWRRYKSGGVWWHDLRAKTRVIRTCEENPGPPVPTPPMAAATKRLLAISTALLVALLGGTVGAMYFFGEGKLHVMAPAGSAVTLTVDGTQEPPLEPGTHRELELRRGSHSVSIEVDGERSSHEVEVSSGSFWAAVIKSTKEQCFVLLDVTDSDYGGRSCEGAAVPRVIERYRAEVSALSWSREPYFGQASLPEVSNNQKVYVIEPVGCSWLELPDRELISHL